MKRPNAADFVRQDTNHGLPRWVADLPPRLAGSRRVRRYFRTREEAEADVRRVIAEARDFDPHLAGLVRRLASLERRELALLLEERERHGLSLAEYRRALADRRPAASAVTLGGLLERFLAAKQPTVGKRHYNNLSKELGRFIANRRELPAAAVTAADLRAYLHGNGWAPDTIRSLLVDLSSFFAFAVAEKLLLENPAAAVDAPRRRDKEPHPLSVPDAARLLAACQRTDPALLPWIALQLFAGIRRAEVMRLTAADLGGEFIRVSGARSKTGLARPIPNEPQLRAWIEAGLQSGGTLPPRGLTRRWAAVREAAGFSVPDWNRNALRHSFCTYHVATHQEPAKTAYQAGHSEPVLRRHYLGIVGQAEGAAFFGLLPDPALLAEGREVARFTDAMTRQRRREAALRQWARKRAGEPAVNLPPSPAPIPSLSLSKVSHSLPPEHAGNDLQQGPARDPRGHP